MRPTALADAPSPCDPHPDTHESRSEPSVRPSARPIGRSPRPIRRSPRPIGRSARPIGLSARPDGLSPVLPLSCLLVALLSLPLPALAADPTKVQQIAVTDLIAVGAPAELAVNLTAVISAEVARYDRFRPIGRREITSLLDVEKQRAFLGCSDDSCLSTLAGGLGVSKILSGQIGRVENSYVLTLQLLDARAARVDASVIQTVPVDQGRLVDAVKRAVTDLIGAQAASKNQPPRLSLAREVRAHAGEAVTLEARCYDPDGDPLRVQWRQVDGPAALLNHPDQPEASFTAAEVGDYTFAVGASDGRSSSAEQSVQVKVLPFRRFNLGVGFTQLIAFNRIVDQDAAGHTFRNRVPYGAVLHGGLSLSDRWVLTGQAEATTMHLFPEDDSLESVESLDVVTINAGAGARYYFPFDAFSLWAGATLGTSRNFYSASDHGVTEHNVRNQLVFAELSAGTDIPFSEQVGLAVLVGLRANAGTEHVAGFREGVTFGVARDGFLWGTTTSVYFYFKL